MKENKKVILIKDDRLGSGDLGAMMIGGFLGAVGAQADLLPKSVVLLNRGVLLGANKPIPLYKICSEGIHTIQGLWTYDGLRHEVPLEAEAENSVALEALKALESQGVEVLFCQTCVEFFALDGKLGVGKVSNAMEISRLLLSHEVLSL